MQILIISHEYPPIGGGAGVTCALLAEQFVDAGHQVTVLTMCMPGLTADGLHNGVHVIRVSSARRRWEKTTALEGLLWVRRVWNVALELQQRAKFDVVHAHFVMPAGIIAEWLKRKFSVPYVISVHGADVPGHEKRRLRLAHALARPWWRLIIRRAACICCPTPELETALRGLVAPFRSVRIPESVVAAHFTPGQIEQRILLCGRLLRKHGFDWFLRAIHDLELPGWTIDLVGSGPLHRRLRRLARRCKTSVTFHGWLDHRDPQLNELYAKATIFVQPGIFQSGQVAVLEAMAAGCAIINTEVPGIVDVVGTAARIIPPRNRVAIQQALQDLTTNPELCRQLGQAARQRVVEHFDATRVARRYLDLFQELVAAKST